MDKDTRRPRTPTNWNRIAARLMLDDLKGRR